MARLSRPAQFGPRLLTNNSQNDHETRLCAVHSSSPSARNLVTSFPCFCHHSRLCKRNHVVFERAKSRQHSSFFSSPTTFNEITSSPSFQHLPPSSLRIPFPAFKTCLSPPPPLRLPPPLPRKGLSRCAGNVPQIGQSSRRIARSIPGGRRSSRFLPKRPRPAPPLCPLLKFSPCR